MSEFAESLVKQLEEHVTKLKKTHEESKQPITDDVPELRLFCLLLERILRFGQREKMTFFGDRKDYWNYLCDCLQGSRALDDSVQSVQRYTHLTTLQGKGRALIRESLVHGNLADMMQVATMAKQTADWYRPDAIMRDQQLSSMLISALYEMNDVAFHLSQAGQELNDNWPSFSKKAFHISNESTGYSTFVSDFDSIRPRDFNVDTSISSANTGNIAEPIVKRTRRKSKAGHVSIDTLEKYMKILEESIQIDSSQETNQDSGAQSDDIDGDDRDDQALPVSVKKLQKKLEGWSVSYESQLNELETELQHERDERVADQADAERLQQHLKDQLNDFRQAENQLKAKVESLASLLSAKSEELDTKQVQLDDLLMKSKLWEVKGIEWQARLDDTHDEMKSLQEDLSESRQKLNAVEADYAFLCSIKNNLDEKLEDTDKQLAEKDALVAELERNFKHSLEESEVTKRDLEEERELKTELESRLEAAETQISKLSNDYNRQESYGEVKGEQKDRDGSPLSDVTTEEGKQVVEQDSQLDYPNIHIKQSNSEEESLRKETVRLLEELNTARMEIEELKQANEDLTRKCTAAEEMVEQREAELAQKASTLHQVPFAMKSIRNSSRDVDKDESTNNLLLAEISEQKTVAVEDETMTDKQVAVSHKEVEVMRRTADEQVRQSGAADEERLQTAETMNTLTDEQQQIWSKVKHDVDTTDVLKDVQGEISNSSFEVEELKHRLNEEEQKRLLTEQECASLKYQMSTDVMQYKQQQDTVKELQREIAELQRMISESTKKLQDSKTEMMTLKGQRDSAHGDKEQIQVKVASVEQQLRQLQVEANSLEDQLFEVTSERDRNRREVLKLDEQLSHIQEQMSLTDKEQIRKMSDLKEKYEQMEEHVVNVAKQKSALWEENAQLRQDLALQLSRSWADEAIARQCNDCRTEFGLMTRKHHCRSCGQIFCAACTDHFVMLASYSKPSRVCSDCLEMIKEAKQKGSVTPSSKRQRSRTQHSASVSSSFRDQARETIEEKSITSEHSPSSALLASTHISSNSSSVDVQNADFNDRNVSAELRHSVSSPTKSREAYAIISEDDIHKVDPSYVLRNNSSSSTSIRKPSSVNDQLTETGPDALTVTEREWMVEARSRHKVPVLVIREKTRIKWQFTADSTALSFGILFKKKESEDEGRELIPMKRVTSAKTDHSGELTAQRAGIYCLVFDNTTSSSSSRKVSYRVEVIKSS